MKPDSKEQVLKGGVANAGAVVKQGEHVLRPSSAYSSSIHKFLSSLHTRGFAGAPKPVSIESDGRERLEYIRGDVALPPYPNWIQTDTALVSITELMRDFHGAARGFDGSSLSWSNELADPEGGPIVCHNDVCLENVVFNNGVAVALLDFDFAAPGRPVYDLAQFARMCVPMDADENTARLGWSPVDHTNRLRLVADTYGLDWYGRRTLLRIISHSMGGIGPFVQRRLDAGDENFIKMWNDMGGSERFSLRKSWFEANRAQFEQCLE